MQNKKEKNLTLFSLAVPKFFELISVQLLNTMNTLLLSGYSQDAVTATSVSAQVISVLTAILTTAITGTIILTSVELGRENRENAEMLGGNGMIMTFLSSAVIGVFVALFAGQILTMMNLTGGIHSEATQYLRIKAMTLPLTMLMSFFNSLLICNGYAAWSVISAMLCNVMNIGLGYIVLYTQINLPVSGVTGVAYAGIPAQLTSVLLSLFFLRKKQCPLKPSLSKTFIKKIYAIGIPSGMCSISYCFSQMVTTSIIVSFGTIVVNAKVYISEIVLYTSRISYAIAEGNSILMGRCRGRGDYSAIERMYRKNTLLAMMFNLSLSVCVFFARVPLLGIFTSDVRVISIAATVMLIDIFIEVARAINHVSEKSLNANGDVKTTLVATLTSCWLGSVLMSYVLGLKLGLGLCGVWIAFAIDEAIRATVYLIRWKSGRWKYTNI